MDLSLLITGNPACPGEIDPGKKKEFSDQLSAELESRCLSKEHQSSGRRLPMELAQDLKNGLTHENDVIKSIYETAILKIFNAEFSPLRAKKILEGIKNLTAKVIYSSEQSVDEALACLKQFAKRAERTLKMPGKLIKHINSSLTFRELTATGVPENKIWEEALKTFVVDTFKDLRQKHQKLFREIIKQIKGFGANQTPKDHSIKLEAYELSSN